MSELKSELDSHLSPAKYADHAVANITSKLASRVQKYSATFSGPIDPKPLLVKFLCLVTLLNVNLTRQHVIGVRV